jgi:uncharacterized protein YecE (DUF72 family)
MVFNTVEIDSTFYAIPAESSVRGWLERTPAEFRFSVKIPSEITHKKRLRESHQDLYSFLERIRLLGEKLGVILIQMPPDFSPREFDSVRSFLGLLPADLRFAIEFRDPGWLTDRVLAELERHNVALTLADSRWIDRSISLSLMDTPTASFTYIRWLGPRELTDLSRIQIDREREMEMWSGGFSHIIERVEAVFGYFNNHFQGHSPASCNLFKRRLNLPVVDPAELIIQPSLF